MLVEDSRDSDADVSDDAATATQSRATRRRSVQTTELVPKPTIASRRSAAVPAIAVGTAPPPAKGKGKAAQPVARRSSGRARRGASVGTSAIVAELELFESAESAEEGSEAELDLGSELGSDPKTRSDSDEPDDSWLPRREPARIRDPGSSGSPRRSRRDAASKPTKMAPPSKGKITAAAANRKRRKLSPAAPPCQCPHISSTQTTKVRHLPFPAARMRYP